MQRFRRVLHLLSSHAALRCALFLALAWIAGLQALAHARGMNTFHDAQFLSAYERHARLAVLGYGEFPFWDPFSCGGLYGLSAPQTRYASPFFLFSLWLGVDHAAALFAVLLPAIGMEGMYRYARSWSARVSLALICAPIFPLCGFFAGGWRWGWVQFLSFCGVPWILLGLRRALRGSRAGAYLCALSAALTLGFGGTWTLPLAAVLALFELLDAALPSLSTAPARAAFWQRLRARARVTASGVVISTLLVAAIAAFRLWPMLESVRATLRVMAGEPTVSLRTLLRVLHEVAPKSDSELGTYYVTPVVLLALLALPLGRARLAWCSAGAILLLSLGHFAPYAPFPLLRTLPLYDTMRYPERCLVLYALSAALVLATSGSAALAWLRKRRGRARAQRWEVGLVALIALGLAPQIKNGWTLMSDVTLAPAPAPRSVPFRQSRGNRWLMSHFAAEGMGSLACGEAYPLPMSTHLRGDLAAEEYLVEARGPGTPDPALGRVQRLHWSPNRIELQVETRREARLAINQNYHPGWHSSAGRLESWDGLLSVVLPPGTHRVVLQFRPRSGVGGLAVSLLALLAGAFYVWRARQPWQRGLLLAAGPVCIAALLVLWPEARWEHPAPVTPAGTPALLSALPGDATRLDVHFDTPLVLVACRVPQQLPTGSDEVTLDLFFERTGPLSAALGIFVHITQPDGRRLQADHTEISGQLYLPRIPPGSIAHDSFRVALPDQAQPGRYEVKVGLWNAYGNGARRGIIDFGRATSGDNMATIGSFTLAGTP